MGNDPSHTHTLLSGTTHPLICKVSSVHVTSGGYFTPSFCVEWLCARTCVAEIGEGSLSVLSVLSEEPLALRGAVCVALLSG